VRREHFLARFAGEKKAKIFFPAHTPAEKKKKKISSLPAPQI